jgi:hypothetical protein
LAPKTDTSPKVTNSVSFNQRHASVISTDSKPSRLQQSKRFVLDAGQVADADDVGVGTTLGDQLAALFTVVAGVQEMVIHALRQHSGEQGNRLA